MQSYAAELNGITLVREHRRTPAWVVAIIYADAIMLHVSRARVCLYYSNLAAQQRTPVFIWITVRYSIIIDIVCRLCSAYEIVANPMFFLTRCVLIIRETREDVAQWKSREYALHRRKYRFYRWSGSFFIKKTL